MLTTGVDSDWPFVWPRFGEESGGIGYQSTLDALLKPSDDGFLGCLQNWPDRDEFSGDASVLIGFAEVAFSCRIWAFSTRRFDELIIDANVGPMGTADEIHHDYAAPCISDRR
jgi:hypothetical protein